MSAPGGTPRVALVTAAAGDGIGQAIARRFAEGGCTVVVTDKHERRTGEVARAIADDHGVDTLGLPLDVGDPDRVRAVVDEVLERCGRVDVLVNNAGTARFEPVHEMAREDWLRIFDVNFTGAYDLTRQVLPSMYERGSGSVVSVSSLAAYSGGAPGEGSYATAKAALQALTRTVAIEGGPHGVRANAVAPGIVWNERADLLRLKPMEYWEERRNTAIPLRRFGRPEEVASVVWFLASDDAGFVTGETVCVGGGMMLQP